MFDFQTNTIINSTSAFNTALTPKDELIIKKNRITIKKSNVISIQQKPYAAPENASVTFTLNDIAKTNTYWRLYLDLRLEGSNNFLFANDLVYKNKPLYIEFVTTSTNVTETANIIKNTVKKYSLALYDTNLFTVSDDRSEHAGTPTTITLTAANEFIRFKKVVLEKYTTSFEDSGVSYSEIKGTLGNGSYAQLLRDVQLPTDANVRYKRLYEDEVPVLNGTYNQYIITEKVKRNFHGQSAVGQALESVTTHNFWVLAGDVSTAFDKEIAKITPEVAKVNTMSEEISNQTIPEGNGVQQDEENI